MVDPAAARVIGKPAAFALLALGPAIRDLSHVHRENLDLVLVSRLFVDKFAQPFLVELAGDASLFPGLEFRRLAGTWPGSRCPLGTIHRLPPLVVIKQTRFL